MEYDIYNPPPGFKWSQPNHVYYKEEYQVVHKKSYLHFVIFNPSTGKYSYLPSGEPPVILHGKKLTMLEKAFIAGGLATSLIIGGFGLYQRLKDIKDYMTPPPQSMAVSVPKEEPVQPPAEESVVPVQAIEEDTFKIPGVSLNERYLTEGNITCPGQNAKASIIVEYEVDQRGYCTHARASLSFDYNGQSKFCQMEGYPYYDGSRLYIDVYKVDGGEGFHTDVGIISFDVSSNEMLLTLTSGDLLFFKNGEEFMYLW